MTLMHIALVGLASLGFLGGILMEASEVLLRLWGKEAGFTLTQLGWLSVIQMVYVFKFLWAPLLPFGFNRKKWILSLVMLGGIVLWILSCFPFFSVPFLLCLAVLILIHASLDMLIVASQRKATSPEHWGISETVCIGGYRLGLMALGAGALFLSARGWTWPSIYTITGAILMVSACVFWCITPLFRFLEEKPVTVEKITLKERFLLPLQEWLRTYPFFWIIALMMVYRAQDGLIDPLRDIFLLSLGVSKQGLIGISKVSNLIAIFVGGTLAGTVIRFFGFFRALLLGIAAHVFCIALLFMAGKIGGWLPVLIFIEQVLRGMALIGFFSFQLTCCQERYAVPQLAFLTAINMFSMFCFGALSGFVVDVWGWHTLFALGLFMNMPALFCVYMLQKRMPR